MNCKSCKFWSKSKQFFNDDIYGVCVKINDSCISNERQAVAYITDCMEGNIHFFHTKENFGCILFQHKEEN